MVWVVRRYLHYFESLGYASLEWVTVEQVREFILKTAAEVKTSSLHNILLYLKHFHIFLKESSLPARIVLSFSPTGYIGICQSKAM